MERTQYILIDLESAPVKHLERVKKHRPTVILFTGGAHPEPPKKLQAQIEELQDIVRVVSTKIIAKNALDFVLTLELGRMCINDPDGYYHIIAKDKGYDAVVRRMRKLGVLSARHDSLDEVPAMMTTAERLNRLERDLAVSTRKRPATKNALESWIQQIFNKSLTSKVVAKTIQYLVNRNLLNIGSSGEVSYPDAA